MESDLIILQKDGKEIKATVLFPFHSEEFNKDYVIFSIQDTEEISAAIVKTSDDGESTLWDIETEEEWDMVQSVLDDWAQDNIDANDTDANADAE